MQDCKFLLLPWLVVTGLAFPTTVPTLEEMVVIQQINGVMSFVEDAKEDTKTAFEALIENHDLNRAQLETSIHELLSKKSEPVEVRFEEFVNKHQARESEIINTLNAKAATLAPESKVIFDKVRALFEDKSTPIRDIHTKMTEIFNSITDANVKAELEKILPKGEHRGMIMD
uniref:DUF148 domain-containing protein n=1 Tax=Rhabditophanes sp. KR3021 TaxID=114890 RepID=A0AC35U9V8_9BILA